VSVAELSPQLPAAAPVSDRARPRSRSAGIARRVGGGLAVLVPIVAISSFITYSLGSLSGSDPAATILGQNGATVTPGAIHRLDAALGLAKRFGVGVSLRERHPGRAVPGDSKGVGEVDGFFAE